MILRQLHVQCANSRLLLRSCIEKYKISQNPIREKSLIQWYNQFWKKFDNPTNTPPFNHLTQIGDPVLRHVASEVPLDKIKSDEIKKLIKQMKKVLRNYNLVGIAAPQIGVSYRVIIIEASERLKEKYPAAVYKNRQMDILPMTTFINPMLKVKNFNIKTFPEGCGSVCGYTGDVNRYEEVLLSGFNEKGDAIELHLKGWNARIAQHEIDHLNGQIFVDIMEKKSFSCVTWQAVNVHGGQLSIPFYPPKQLLKKTVIT